MYIPYDNPIKFVIFLKKIEFWTKDEDGVGIFIKISPVGDWRRE